MNEMRVYCIESKDYMASNWTKEDILEVYNDKLNKNCTINDVRDVDLDNEHMLYAIDYEYNKDKYDLNYYIIKEDCIWEKITLREAINRNEDLNYKRPYLICSTYYYD